MRVYKEVANPLLPHRPIFRMNQRVTANVTNVCVCVCACSNILVSLACKIFTVPVVFMSYLCDSYLTYIPSRRPAVYIDCSF